MANKINVTSPGLIGQDFSVTAWGQTIAFTDYGNVPEMVEMEAFGGRINEYDDLATVNDPRAVLRQQFDGKATLDLRKVGIDGSEVLTGTTSTGQPVAINVSRQAVKYGWGDATYYMLETDPATGDLIIEPGDHHRKLYISGAASAHSQATIAAHWNAANGTSLAASAITAAWLIAHPEYGGSEAMKVNAAVGKLIYDYHRAEANYPGQPNRTRTSIHVGIERGYDYPTSLSFIGWGESPLHPILVFAYGTGDDPLVSFSGNNPFYHSNFVFVGVNPKLTPYVMSFENWLTADIKSDEELGSNPTQKASGLTLYRTAVHDCVKPIPDKGKIVIDGVSTDVPEGTSWNANRNIKCGAYIANTAGVYLLDSYWDHNGWSDTHEIVDGKVTGNYNDGQFGQPPTQYSHNIYSQFDNADMTWDGMINMRASSVSGQMRIGGWQWGISSIANQVASQNHGLPYDEKPGEYSFWSTNYRVVATHSGNKPMWGEAGARQWGLGFIGPYETDIDCAIFNRADPDDAADIAWKGAAGSDNSGTQAIATSTRFPPLYSSVMSYNWSSVTRGTQGLSEAFIKTITIQRRCGQVLGRGENGRGTIEEYSQYVESLTPRQRQLEIRALNRYLLSAREPTLEIPLEDRTVPEIVTFKPDWRGEGFRLDSPINLSSKSDLINGDSLDLHGNYAKWVGKSLSLNALTVGAGGLLDVNSGKVSFESVTPGAHVKTSNCGKLYVKGFDGSVEVRGGRFAALTASKGGVEASGQGQFIVGPEWTVENGETFRIVGDMGKVGWDSISGSGILRIKAGATLEFEATPVIQYGLQSGIEGGHAFNPWHSRYSTMLGQTSGATGEFDSVWRSSMKGYARIRDIEGMPVVGEYTTAPFFLFTKGGLIEAVLPATIGKIHAGWAGRLGTVNTTATFQVILEAGAILKVKNRDRLEAKTYDLGGGTGTRVTYVDQGATLPAGVSITGGKLVYTVPA